jgi:hypothetical protein
VKYEGFFQGSASVAGALVGLNPTGGLDVGSVVLGTIGVVATGGVAVQLWHVRAATTLTRNWGRVLSLIMAVYGAQVISGLLLTSRSGEAESSTTFIYILFAMGIDRAWMLLGMAGRTALLGRFTSRPGAPPAAAEEPTDPGTRPTG